LPTIAGNTDTYTIAVNETQQVAGLISQDFTPSAGSQHLLVGQQQYVKCRLTLQSNGASSWLDGYNENGCQTNNSGRGFVTAFGTVGGFGGSNRQVNPLAIDMRLAFTIQIQATAGGGGSGAISLTQAYTRYVRLGP
jgi:hypothetical protein